MRTGKIVTWVCGAVLCCTVSAAFCQTLSGSLAEGTALAADAPHSGMGAVGAREVSADANSTINADAKASVNTEAVTGVEVYGGGSGAGARPGRLDFRIGLSSDKPVNGRLESEATGERSPEFKRGGASGHAAIRSMRRNARNGRMQAEQSRSGQVSRARNGSAHKLAAGATPQLGAAYSKDFPDSTKGTALLSPPDSTASPLDWTPGLNFSFSDFAEQSFLKPSLHGGSSLQKRRVAASTNAPVSGGIPGNALTYPDLSTSVGDSLRVRVPDPLAGLQSH